MIAIPTSSPAACPYNESLKRLQGNIYCRGNRMNRPLAKAVFAVVVTFGFLLTAAGGETNSTAVPYMLPTAAPSFFYVDYGMAATYYKFDTNGMYVHIVKEHLGVWPIYGKWIQATNGIVTMTATNLPRFQLIETVVPMSYKQKVFLVWPKQESKQDGGIVWAGQERKADAGRVCQQIDSGTNQLDVPNEFMISAEEFTQGAGKPYGFKFYQEMNKRTGADE